MADKDPKADSPEQLSDAEKMAHNAEEIKKGYKPEAGVMGSDVQNPDSELRGFIKKHRKKIIGGGVVGATVGVSLFGFTFLHGPFKFIHFAQMLQGFHLNEGSDQSDDRLVALYRLIKDPSKPENTRMGVLGNKLADRAEKKFNANGVESSYTRAFGFLDGYIVDPDKLGGEFADLRGASAQTITREFEQRYGIVLQTRDDNSNIPEGKLFASARGLGYFGEKNLVRTIAKQGAGYRGITGAIQARVMGKRAGIDWHPIRRLDNAILKSFDQRYSDWKNRREASIQQGAEAPIASTESKADPNDPNARQRAGEVEETTTELLEDAHAAGGEAAKGNVAELEHLESDIRSKLTGVGGAVGGALVWTAGVLCAAQFLSTSYDEAVESNVIPQLKRTGMGMITLGNQLMYGSEDLDLEELGFYDDLTYDPKTGQSVVDAPDWQHNMGQTVTGEDPPEVRVDPKGNMLTQILSQVPGIGTVCAVQENPFVQGGLFVIGFIGGPVSAVLTTGASLAAGPLIDKYLGEIIAMLAGRSIDSFPQGPKLGSYAGYGTHFARGDIGTSAGGIPLTDAQTAELAMYQNASSRQEFQSKSLYARLFDLRDYRSLASRVFDKQQVDPNRNLASLGNGLVNLFKLPASIFGQIFSAKAAAANPTPYDYGVPVIGTPASEMIDEVVANPYKNANTVMNHILPGPDGDMYIARAQICNGMNVNLDGTVVSTGQSPKYKDIVNPENKCADPSDDWMRVRFYIKDTQIMEAAACYEGDREACHNVNFDTGALEDPVNPTEEQSGFLLPQLVPAQQGVA